MALFLSRSVHKVDKKGRVSVPAAFRAALGDQLSEGIALTKPVNRLAAIEASPISRVNARMEQLETLNENMPHVAALAMVTLGNMRKIPFDGEGRIILPEDLISYAGITDSAVFVGLGKYFQIWEANALEAYMLEAEAMAAQHLDLLSPQSPAQTAAPQTPSPGTDG